MKEMRHSSIQRRNFWCLAGGVTFKRMTSHWRRLGKRLFTCNVWTFAINCQHLSLDSLFWSLVHAENTNLLSRGKIPVWMVSSLTGLDATWQYNLLTIWGTFNFCNNIRYGGIFQPLSVKQQWIKAINELHSQTLNPKVCFARKKKHNVDPAPSFKSWYFLNGPTPAFFIYFLSFQCLQQINVKIVHPVFGAGIQTHNLLMISHLPLPPDQGSCPS